MTSAAGAGPSISEPSIAPDTIPAYSMRDLFLYFLRLGTVGFGGPIALAGYMQRDLVERRGWFTKQDYMEGLALAQLAPGPLAAQLAIYLGWLRGGNLGATLIAFAFVAPSFVMVLVLSALYLRFGGIWWMQGLFYGIGAAVIAIIGRSAYKLVRLTLGSERLLWAICATGALVTIWTESEVVWLFFAAGLLVMLVKAPPRWSSRTSAAALGPIWLVSGLHGAASGGTLWQILWYFSEAGAFVFGSGLAIIPFLYGGVVQEFHWLTERQFVDAVAVAMITPGPVVITVAFIGYLGAGPLGAIVASIGVFLPCYLFTIIPAKYFRRSVNHPSVKACVEGVTAAATGAIVGAAVVLGRRAVFDVPTVLIAVATLVCLVYAKKVPEPVVIVAAGIVGLLCTT